MDFYSKFCVLRVCHDLEYNLCDVVVARARTVLAPTWKRNREENRCLGSGEHSEQFEVRWRAADPTPNGQSGKFTLNGTTSRQSPANGWAHARIRLYIKAPPKVGQIFFVTIFKMILFWKMTFMPIAAADGDVCLFWKLRLDKVELAKTESC